jgi:hypothetical protein
MDTPDDEDYASKQKPRAFLSQVETPDDSQNATIQEVRAPVLIQSKPKAL